jgi:lambda repressor-like predicted transcriptional regulator
MFSELLDSNNFRLKLLETKERSENMTVEAKMAEAVESSGMTVRAVSVKTGISYSRLVPSLRGRRELRAEEFLALCKLLRLDPVEVWKEAKA